MKLLKYLLQCVILLSIWTIVLPSRAQYVHASHLSWEVVWNYSNMTPSVVYYTLSASDFSGSITQKPKHFKQDYLLPPPRVKTSAFSFSGYQRGHLCPSGDRDTRRDWFKDTYFTSNVVAMTPETNAGAWRDIEIICRRLAVNGHRLRIACGPIVLPTSGGWCKGDPIPVPVSLWKVARCEVHPSETWSWIVPNVRSRVLAASCAVPTDSVYVRCDSVISNFVRSWINR